ncbi:MAG TPA: hypothetical protein VNN62_07395 [Methylomirabilota bacterium]|nr:hypothetical protein [Methylomirabilota bacterium]
MQESVTLEQVETLVVRLPPKDQLKLLAHISERLSNILLAESKTESDHEQQLREERLRLAGILCDEVEDISDDAKGSFDAAEDIRRMREERIAQLCRSDA